MMRAVLLLALIASSCYEGATPQDVSTGGVIPATGAASFSTYNPQDVTFSLSQRPDGRLDLALNVQFIGDVAGVKVWLSSSEPFASDENRRMSGDETLLWEGSWPQSGDEILPVIDSSFTVKYAVGDEAETSEVVQWTARLELISPVGSASTLREFYMYRDGDHIISDGDAMVVRQAQLQAALRERGLEGASPGQIGREAPDLARQLVNPMQPAMEPPPPGTWRTGAEGGDVGRPGAHAPASEGSIPGWLDPADIPDSLTSFRAEPGWSGERMHAEMEALNRRRARWIAQEAARRNRGQ